MISSDARDIFLSHSSADKPFVRRLAADIENQQWNGRQLSVWLDEAEIQPGQSIPGMIEQGLKGSRFIAFVMTPNYFNSQSGWTDAEWHAAVATDPDNRRKRLLPILAASTPELPFLLGHLRHLDMRSDNYDADMPRLLSFLREEPLPRPGMVRGRIIEHGKIANDSLAAEQIPAVSAADRIDEKLSCNLLPVDEMPAHIYEADLKGFAEGRIAKTDVWERINEAAIRSNRRAPNVPPFRIHNRKILTFYDLHTQKSIFAPVVDKNTIQRMDAASFMKNQDHQKLLISLLNMHLSKFLNSQNIKKDPGKSSRFFFLPKGKADHVIEWKPARKKATRTVARRLDKDNPKTEWINAGAYLDICELAGRLFLKIQPTWVLTEDGHNPKGGADVGRIISKWTNKERNLSVLYHVRFWSTILAGGQDKIVIPAHKQAIKLLVLPAQIQLPYGIKSDQKNLDQIFEAEATLAGQAEDDIIRRAMEFYASEIDEDDESDSLDDVEEES